jgi:hypothetical protein
MDAEHDWIFCLCANESFSEPLEAAVFEWKANEHGEASVFNVNVREESDSGWKAVAGETRLVNRKKINWTGDLPPTSTNGESLGGDLLRFRHP